MFPNHKGERVKTPVGRNLLPAFKHDEQSERSYAMDEPRRHESLFWLPELREESVCMGVALK